MRNAGGRVGSMVASAHNSVALYGTKVSGMTGQQLRSLRASTAAAILKLQPGQHEGRALRAAGYGHVDPAL
eukprot:6032379-Karenia_brevis.AAC.1